MSYDDTYIYYYTLLDIHIIRYNILAAIILLIIVLEPITKRYFTAIVSLANVHLKDHKRFEISKSLPLKNALKFTYLTVV